MRRNLLSTLFVSIALAAPPAAANVSLKNGNFFEGFTDIIYPGGYEPKIERVYNSKTPFKGIFGWGWGMEYEVYIDIYGDGTLSLHEYGGGAENVFSLPGHPTAADVSTEVEKIVAAEKKPVGELPAYRAKLIADSGYRNDEWSRLAKAKLVVAPDVPASTEFISNRFSHQRLVRTAQGYLRTFDDKHTQLFGTDGSLRRLSDANGNALDFTRDAHGRIATIRDNLGRQMAFSYSPKGLVTSIVGSDGKKTKSCAYRYSAADDLVYSKDTDGNIYRYEYTSRHNMVKISYMDKTTLEIGYHTYDRHENVRLVKDRDGTRTVYSYYTDRTNPAHYKIGVEAAQPDGALLSTSLYEYSMGRKAGGEEYTAKLVTVLDGDRTSTTYDENCATPLRIEHGGEATTFRYDAKCHVTYKDTPSETKTLTYDAVVDKVTRLDALAKATGKKTWSTYSYDAKGNLLEGADSEGRRVSLSYDALGRITTMVVRGDVVKFVYNQMSKPVEITAVGIGTIKTTYTASGEIAKVEGDRKISLRVTSLFQELLDITRPAGISLSF